MHVHVHAATHAPRGRRRRPVSRTHAGPTSTTCTFGSGLDRGNGCERSAETQLAHALYECTRRTLWLSGLSRLLAEVANLSCPVLFAACDSAPRTRRVRAERAGSELEPESEPVTSTGPELEP